MIAVVACVGCWAGNEQPPSVLPGPIANTTPPAPAALRRSVWDGHYTCAQGLTALRLSLERAGDRVEATFAFGPHDANPQLPHGVFRMIGVATRDTDGLALRLSPTEWVERPPGYEMVGLYATSTADGRILRGRIDHPSCREVELTRLD